MYRTPTQTACTDAHSVSAHTLHSMITFHHANTRGSKELNGSRLHSFASRVSCHPRGVSRSLPHLTLTTSTSSLSPSSPFLPTFSPSHPSLLVLDPYLPCEVPGRVADQHKSHLSKLQNVENSSGRRRLDQLSPSTRQRTTVEEDQIPCRSCMQLNAGRLRPRSDFSKGERTSRTEDSAQSSWQTQQQQQQPNTSVSAASSTRRQRNKVTQQITQNCPAPGKWSGVLSHLLRKKSLNLKSTSELKELRKMWSWKMKREWVKFKK